MTTVRVLYYCTTIKLNKTPTTVKQQNIVNILILCTSTEHVFIVSAVLSHYTTPYNDTIH